MLPAAIPYDGELLFCRLTPTQKHVDLAGSPFPFNCAFSLKPGWLAISRRPLRTLRKSGRRDSNSHLRNIDAQTRCDPPTQYSSCTDNFKLLACLC